VTTTTASQAKPKRKEKAVSTEKAINQDREFVAQVTRSLPEMSSDIKQGWIENPRGLSKVLEEALCPSKEVVGFPVFKTIKLGTHKSTDSLRSSLKDNGNHISNWGNDIFGNITLAEYETEVTLHVATVKELTGKDRSVSHEINKAIRSKGYELCPAEVGPQLRLQYLDQPNGEWIRVAMEPIADSHGLLRIFYVGYVADERWLRGVNGHRDNEWDGDTVFIFVSRK